MNIRAVVCAACAIATIVIMSVLSACGLASSPLTYAAATATILAVQNEDAERRLDYSRKVMELTEEPPRAATRAQADLDARGTQVAISALGTVVVINATGTAIAQQAQSTESAREATATAMQQQAIATTTMMPSTNNAAGIERTILAYALVPLIVVGLLGILAVISLIRRESRVVARTPSGAILQLPTPVLWQVASLWQFFKTGKPLPIADSVVSTAGMLGPSVQAVPGAAPIVADGGATADHYLTAFISAQATNAVDAMFDNPMPAKEREERIKTARLIGGEPAAKIAAPQTRVLSPKEADAQNWIAAIASAYDVPARELVAGTPMEGELVQSGEQEIAD